MSRSKESYQSLPVARPEDERWILAMAMISERAAAQLITTCNANWFSNHDCKTVFKAIYELFGESAPWDFETYRLVAERLNKNGVKLHGYADNLNALVVDYQSDGYGIKHIGYYIKVLLESSYKKRNLITLGAELPQIADDYDDPYSEVLARAQALLTDHSGDKGEDIIDRQERMARGEYVGIKTRMPEIDEFLGIWRNGHFILLGADSSIGKTAFAGDLARKLAMTGIHVGYASLEMNIEEMTERWVSGHGNHRFGLEIPYMAFNTGSRAIRDNIARIKEIKADFDSLPINFIYARMFNVNQIKAEFVRVHARYPNERWFFIVDYVQLINTAQREGTRERELALISQSLKDMAGQLNAPILVLSQFNKSKDYREEKRPTEFSFRDSGALYHDADKALALFSDDKSKSERELIILKNRGGISGKTIMLTYSAQYGRFWTPQEDIPEPGWKQDELPQPKPIDQKTLDGNMPDPDELPF